MNFFFQAGKKKRPETLRKKKITKIDFISKTMNCTKKKSCMQKMSVRLIPINPANVAPFEEN